MKSKKKYRLINSGEYQVLKFSGDKDSQICLKFTKVFPIKVSSVDTKKYFLGVPEFY